MPSLGVFGQGSAAKLYLPVRGVQASSLTTGYLTGLCLAAASFDGNSAILTASGTAGTLPGFIGVANADVAVNGYGLVQCWGHAVSIFMSQVATSITFTVGDACVPGAEAGGCASVVPTYLNAGFKFIISSGSPNTASLAKASNYMGGIIRCF